MRACYAALGMRDAMRRYSEEVRRTQGIEVHIRVGRHSGEVVVRAIASDLHMDYTAVGQTIHLAARMEQLAPPHCRRGLGTLYLKTAQCEEARATLSAAIALYRAMDMMFWLPQAEAVLAQAEER